MKKKYLFQLAQRPDNEPLCCCPYSAITYMKKSPTNGWDWHFCADCSHLTLNTWWLKKLFTGEYSGYRAFQTVVNFATFLLFLTACISGILLSKHLFAEMPFHLTDDFTRKSI